MPSTDSSTGNQLTSSSVDNYIGAFISQAADVALCLAEYTQLPSNVLIKEEQDEQVTELQFDKPYKTWLEFPIVHIGKNVCKMGDSNT